MRVLFVSAGYPPGARGGTEIHARDLAVALRARGVEVAVFCRESDPSRKDYEEREDVVDGVRVRRLKYDFGDVSDFSAIHDNPKIDAAFLRFAKEFRPDVVHVHHVTCLSSGILDAARDGARAVVMTLHDFWTVCPRGQRITPKLERCDVVDRATCAPCLDSLWPHFGMTREKLDAADVVMRRRLNSMDALLAPSAAHRESMLEFGLDPARVVVLPHGLPLERYATARRPRAAAKRVGFIGSVLPTKGVHVLVDAFVSAGLKDATLAIYGEAPNFHGDTDYLRRLKDAAKGARVEFRGAYDPEDLAAILRDLDLVVAPSLWRESFCLTVREAFAAGVPAIASDLGGLSEAFEDGVGGRKVPPGDAAAIAARLSEVVGDPAAYARLVATVPEVKSVAQNAEETAALYARVLDGGAAASSSDGPATPAAAASSSTEAVPPRMRYATGGLVDGGSAVVPYATVFLPTWNGGPLLATVLDRVLSQKTSFPFEVLIIDSGSTDETLDIIARRPAIRLVRIPNHEFNHGLTRNRGVAEARGEIVALLTQDAEPIDDFWLERLVSNFDDPRVAGAYCAQKPRPECDPFQRDRLKGWTKESGPPEVRELASLEAYEAMAPYDRYRLCAFDDVASCVRKSAMAEIPYAKRQFGEDVEWGRRAILAGRRLVMDPGAVVIHSHDAPVLYEFKRVYLDHQNLFDLFGLRTIPKAWMVAWFSTRYFLKLLPVVWSDDRSFWFRLLWTLKLPLYAFTQNLAQYWGAKSVLWRREGRMAWLDRLLRKSV